MTNTERWRIVEEWKTNQMSMAAFCRTKKVKYATFRLWLKRFDDDGNLPNGSAEPELVKLEIPPASHFAASSEKWSGEDKAQMHLFDEAESIADDQTILIESEEITYKRRKRGRKPIPDNIPRRVVVHHLDESERCCPH